MKKSVLITGGSRGIGAATVRKFIDNQYQVAFFYEKNHEKAQRIQEETGAVAIQCDIADKEAVKIAVKTAKAMLGVSAFDGLICNAAISETGLFSEMTTAQWKRIMEVNINGSMYVAKAILPEMISRKAGSVVMLSSIWGQTGASCEVAYSTTKAAIIGLTKSLAKEVGPSGVRINCVAPGIIDTEMNKGYDQATMEGLKEEIPLNRFGDSTEVAEAIFFLTDSGSSYITGQIIGVNGGFLI